MSKGDSTRRRPRGRPRAYESGAALDAALMLFWTRGYAATSVDDLAAAMRMSKPSVYAAFGNKQALYAAAVHHYVATLGGRYLTPLTTVPALRDALLGFYAAVIDVVTGKHGPLGCVVACTLPAEAGDSEAARTLLADVFAQLDGAIARRLHAARIAGGLPPRADPALLSQIVISGMFALSIRARAGMSRRKLTALARGFVDLVLPHRQGATSPGSSGRRGCELA